MSKRERKVHLRDIRLRSNAGLDLPVCIANARLLDTENTWPTSGDPVKVTCRRCAAAAVVRYPWAYNKAKFVSINNEGEVIS